MRRGALELVKQTVRIAAERLLYNDFVMPKGVPVPREHRLSMDQLEGMKRDPNVWASLLLRATATFPGYHLRPYDDSPEAAGSCDICKTLLDYMPNSLLRVVQEDILIETYTFGWCVGELVQQDLVVNGIPYIGLRGLKIKPARTFENYITLDEFGNLERIQQLTTRGFVDADLTRTFYITNEASPSYPYGNPVLDHVFDACVEKQHVFRAWSHFCDVFGGGRYLAYLDEDDMGKWASTVLAILKGQQTGSVSVLPSNAKVEAQETTGTGANVYAQNMAECDKQIRLGILGQETVNAEGDKTGTYGSRRAQMGLLMQMFAGKGDVLAEQLTEQVIAPLCAWNHISPVPRLVPSPEAQPDEDVAGILTAIGSAYTSGLFTQPLPPTTQIELTNTLLGKVGLKPIDMPQTPTLPLVPIPAAAPVVAQRGMLSASKPAPDKARQRSEILKLKPALIAAENEAIRDVSETWQGIVPDVVDAILKPLVDGKSKNWYFVETLDGAKVRSAVIDGITTGGRQMQDAFVKHVFGIFDRGWKDAKRQMPGKIQPDIPDDPMKWKGHAAIRYVGRGVTPANARNFLRNDIYMSLSDPYTTLGKQAYYILKDALYGYESPEIAARKLASYLAEFGLESYAASMVQTMMMYAYNEGRMSLFRQFEVAGGTGMTDIPGYEFVATMDDRTTPECARWNGTFFRVDDPSRVSPPMDYGCRSTLVPVFGTDELWGGGTWATAAETKDLPRPRTGFGGS